jgi:hypothetical protein
VLSPSGGCAAFRYVGAAAAFDASTHNGITSSGAGWFPTSLEVIAVDSHHCGRSNFTILAILLILLWTFTLLRPPLPLLFAVTLSAGFAYVTFEVSETPFNAPAQAFFTGQARYVAAAALVYPFWRMFARHALRLFSAQTQRAWPPLKFLRDADAGADAGAGSENARCARLCGKRDDVDADANADGADNNDDDVDDDGADFAVGIDDISFSGYVAQSTLVVADNEAAADDIVQSGVCDEDDDADDIGAEFEALPTFRQLLGPTICSFALFVVPFVISLHQAFIPYAIPNSDIDLNSRLFSHGSSAGVIILVLIIVVAAVFAVILHVRYVWRARLMRVYAFVAAAFVGLTVVISLLFSGEYTLHVHHSILPLFLLPLTRFPRRASVIFMAVLLGVFVNGMASWEWAPMWEPARGGGGGGSEPPVRPDAPLIIANVTSARNDGSSGSGSGDGGGDLDGVVLSWLPQTQRRINGTVVANRYDGNLGSVILANNVLVYRGDATNFTFTGLLRNSTYAFTLQYVYSGSSLGVRSEALDLSTQTHALRRG